MGPVVWTVINEVFPGHIRGRAVAVATAVNWGSAFLVSQSFLSLIEAIGNFMDLLAVRAVLRRRLDMDLSTVCRRQRDSRWNRSNSSGRRRREADRGRYRRRNDAVSVYVSRCRFMASAPMLTNNSQIGTGMRVCREAKNASMHRSAPRHRWSISSPRATGLSATRRSPISPTAGSAAETRRPWPVAAGSSTGLEVGRAARGGYRARQDQAAAARRVAGWSMPFRANSAARAALSNHITYGA